MKPLLLAAALAFVAGCATAPETPAPPPAATAVEIPVHVYEDESKHIALMPGACADSRSLMMMITAGPEYSSRWRAIRSSWRGRDGSWREFAGCWLELSKEEAGAPGDVLVLVFEDGERHVVLKSELLGAKRKSGA